MANDVERRRKEMAKLRKLLPEKYDLDLLSDYVDAAAGYCLGELVSSIKDANDNMKVKITNGIINIGRYLETKKLNQIEDNSLEIDDPSLITDTTVDVDKDN